MMRTPTAPLATPTAGATAGPSTPRNNANQNGKTKEKTNNNQPGKTNPRNKNKNNKAGLM